MAVRLMTVWALTEAVTLCAIHALSNVVSGSGTADGIGIYVRMHGEVQGMKRVKREVRVLRQRTAWEGR